MLAIHTEVKFYPKVKSQTGLTSLRVSCKRALNVRFETTLLPALIFDYNEKLSAKWLSF